MACCTIAIVRLASTLTRPLRAVVILASLRVAVDATPLDASLVRLDKEIQQPLFVGGQTCIPNRLIKTLRKNHVDSPTPASTRGQPVV
jgi:hypothetical protein